MSEELKERIVRLEERLNRLSDDFDKEKETAGKAHVLNALRTGGGFVLVGLALWGLFAIHISYGHGSVY